MHDGYQKKPFIAVLLARFFTARRQIITCPIKRKVQWAIIVVDVDLIDVVATLDLGLKVLHVVSLLLQCLTLGSRYESNYWTYLVLNKLLIHEQVDCTDLLESSRSCF